MVASWICVVMLIAYVIIKAEPLQRNPMTYTARQYGLSCFCNDGHGRYYTFNSTNIFMTTEGYFNQPNRYIEFNATRMSELLNVSGIG